MGIESFAGGPTSLEHVNGDIASFWQTFATASRYTEGQVWTSQYAPAGKPSCDAGVAMARVRPGDEARLAKLLSGQLNFRFSELDGAEVAAGPSFFGPSTGYGALGLAPGELVAAVAVEPTVSRSQAFLASVSADGLPTGVLVAAVPGVPKAGGTLRGTAAACLGTALRAAGTVKPRHSSAAVTVELRSANGTVAEQFVTDTNLSDQPYTFFEPAGRYTLSAVPGPYSVITVVVRAGATVTAGVGITCLL